jgi:ATP-binding cassette subfamily B protein
MSPRRQHKYRLLAPEVVQTSAMDCGPAALKSVLEGHGIHVSYARLRDACQTDVDGTSIDTMEEFANQWGLAAEQVVQMPADTATVPSLTSSRDRGGDHYLWSCLHG